MRNAAAAAYLLAVFLIVYGPVVGQGFVADDFGWVHSARTGIGATARTAFAHSPDFYRPLVSTSFAVNHTITGLDPRPYGLTNLVLLIACAALVAWVAVLGGMTPAFGVFAAGIFAFNPHGVDMAVLWVSGRTSLLLTIFSLGAAVAFLKRSKVMTAALSLCALFSKEEATVLPVMFFLWAFFEARTSQSTRHAIAAAFQRTYLVWIGAAFYLALRLQSGAMWPTNAPWFYRFTLDPHILARNVQEYADRAGTLSAVIVLVVFVCARAKPLLESRDRVFLYRCACWLIGGFALTLFIPVRSSLYALFPSVGAALAASALTASFWHHLSNMQKRTLIVVALVVPLALFPVYRARGFRWFGVARLSTAVTTQLVDVVAANPQVRVVVIQDDRSTRASLANAFGEGVSEVASLYFKRPVTMRIEGDAVTHVAPGELLLVLDGKTGRLKRGGDDPAVP